MMTREQATSFIKKFGRVSKNGSVKYPMKKIRNSPEFVEILKLVDKIPGHEKFTPRELLISLQEGFNSIPKCLTCGAVMPFKTERKKGGGGYYIRKFCSLKCFNNLEENKLKASVREKKMASSRLKKRKKTIKEKYGSLDNWPGRGNLKKANNRLKTDKDYREKRVKKTKETNLQKYGVEYLNKLPGEGSRRRLLADETCIKKYGIENPTRKHYNTNNFKNLTKEVIENTFKVDGHLAVDKLQDFINCGQTAAYKIAHSHDVAWDYDTGGFNPDKPAVLYYLKDLETGLYKIGITNKTLVERFGKDFCSKRAMILLEQTYENGEQAYLAEQELLQAFIPYRCTNESWPEEKGGKTEFFKEDVLKIDVKRITDG